MKKKEFEWLKEWLCEIELNIKKGMEPPTAIAEAIGSYPPPIDEEEYKTLEQQIIELWKSRGLEVTSITVGPNDNESLNWTIIAKETPK